MSASDEPRAPIERMPKIEKGPRETPNPSRVPYHTEKPASDEPRVSRDYVGFRWMLVPERTEPVLLDVLAEVARIDAKKRRMPSERLSDYEWACFRAATEVVKARTLREEGKK